MIIVRYLGGLGNQMFQYAFSVALKMKSQKVVLADYSDYERNKHHNGYELMRVFGIENKAATKSQIRKYTCLFSNGFLQSIYIKLSKLRPGDIKERGSHKYYSKIIELHKDGYYDGFWQSYKYFDEYRDILVNDFCFPPFHGKNKDLEESIKYSSTSISIHVRRGDYLKAALYKGLCQLDYYKTAIEKITNILEGPIHFYIFSNDIHWCKKYIIDFLGDNAYTFVDWNIGLDSYRDMQLMSICRGNIIANSSFSWWAAYLNDRADKIVIAPRKWVNLDLEYDMQPSSWILI